MGEIKSTIDIIMEKTKGMTISENEKQEIKKKELIGKIRGLIQRFMDGVINLDGLKIEIASIEEDQEKIIREAVMNEFMSRIRLGEDNSALLEVLGVTNPENIGTVKKLFDDFKEDLDQKRNDREKDEEENKNYGN